MLTKDAQLAQDAIDQLKAAAKPGASYEEKQGAKEAYDKLTEEQKKLADKEADTSSNYTKVSKDLTAIDKVIELLDKVKKPYAPVTKEQITAAKDAFSNLTDDQKSAFPKTEKDKLDALTDKLDRAVAVENQIKALPDEYPTNGTKDADIMGAKVAYDALTDEEKSMVDPDLKTKLDELYKDMLDSKSEEEKKKLQAGKDFTDKVNDAKSDPMLDKIKDLIEEKEKLPEGVYDSLPDSIKKDYEDLVKAKDIIEKLDKVTKDNITDSSGNGTISEEAKDAVKDYDKASDAIKDIVDKATDNKAKDIKDVADALDKISKIPVHEDEEKDPTTGEVTKPATGVGEDCKDQTDNKHTSDTHQKVIEDAKDALQKLPDSAKDLIPDDKNELVDTEYEKLLGYLEYINRAVTDKTEVEVVGITDKAALPEDSATVGKTIIRLVAKDSRPSSMPKTPIGKGEMLSVDVKLVASLYANASDITPVATEPVQPKLGESVLVKLLVPAGYKNDTLELWHVKDNGLHSRITNFWLTTESGGVYAVFEVTSFSHFVLFGEKRASSGGGWVPPAPKPEIPVSDHGSTTVTPQQTNPGDKTTVNPKPDEGYVVDNVIVTDQNGKKIAVKDNGDGTYSYTQPSGKVIITVTFKPEDVRLPWNPFADVTERDWFYDSVKYVYEKGLMNGTSDTAFRPYTTTSRGMIVTILWRLEGKPTAKSANPYADVSTGAYYDKAVAWAAENGIVKGYDNGNFGPNNPITREQLAAILYRYTQFKGIVTPITGDLSQFTDQPSTWAADAMQWAVGVGIISGRGNGTLDATGNATRAETSAMLARFLN